MVFTLHRYIFKELFKVFILSALALTVMLSIGSILKPVQEYGVGPKQVFEFMLYFLPITLTFVLPIAALFAASLVYGRLASDNELDACKASGISVMTLVYPGIVLAVMMSILNVFLSFYVMPDFIERAEKAVKADAKQIVFRNIQRKGYCKLNKNYMIYADYADSQKDILSGVLIAQNEGGKVQRVITTETAKVEINPRSKYNEVKFTAHNTYQIGSGDQGWVYFEWLPVTAEVPALLTDNIKFKKIGEIKEIRNNPLKFSPVDRLAKQMYSAMTVELLANEINSEIQKDEKIYRFESDEKKIAVAGSGCEAVSENKLDFIGDVTLTEFDANDKAVKIFKSKKASLYLGGSDKLPLLTLELKNASSINPDGSEELEGRVSVSKLQLPEAVKDSLPDDILQAADQKYLESVFGKTSGSLRGVKASLAKEVRDTLLGIRAEINSRLAFGIGCIPMILIGIALGIVNRGGHMLSAFAASCIPAAVLLVCILLGKNLTYNTQTALDYGTFVIWLGVILLTITTFIIYRRLMKN